jgi:hypothetical protein
MRRNRTAMLAVVFSVAFASTAFAQGMGQGRMGMGPGPGIITKLCAKEIETHCANTQGPAQRSCLEAKSKELSENCQEALESTGPNMGPGTGPVARLCMKEIAKFCAEVPHENGKVRICLEEKRKELGEACTIALDNTGPGRFR